MHRKVVEGKVKKRMKITGKDKSGQDGKGDEKGEHRIEEGSRGKDRK